MRPTHTLFSLLLVLLVTGNLHAQHGWQRNRPMTEPASWGISSYQAMAVLGDSVIVVAANDRFLLRSVDGGTNWSSLSISRYPDIRFMQKLGANSLIAVTDSGTMLLSYDQGLTWSAHYFRPWQRPLSLSFSDSLHGFVGFYYETESMLATNDGGNTWQVIPKPVRLATPDVVCRAGGSDIYIGDSYSIYRSTDMGVSWTSTTIPGGVMDIKFFDRSTGLATGATGKIYRTTDSGITWQSGDSLVTRTISVVDDSSAYSYARDSYLTTDRGLSWVRTPSLLDNDGFVGADFSRTGFGFAMGFYGTTFRTSKARSGEWYGEERINHATLQFGSFSDSLHGSLIANSNIFLTEDGGKNWPRRFASNAGAHSVIRIGPNIVLVTEYYHIYRSTNAGHDWQLVVHDTLVGALRYANGIVAGGGEGHVLLSLDSGASWVKNDLTAPHSVAYEVVFSTPMDGVMAPYYLSVTHDGGRTWSDFTKLDGIKRIFSFGDLLIAAGTKGIFRSKDTGRTWTLYSKRPISEYVEFSDPRNGLYYPSGISGGYIYRTTDGGLTWNMQQTGYAYSPKSRSFQSLAMPDSLHNFAAADYGTIIMTRNAGFLPAIDLPHEIQLGTTILGVRRDTVFSISNASDDTLYLRQNYIANGDVQIHFSDSVLLPHSSVQDTFSITLTRLQKPEVRGFVVWHDSLPSDTVRVYMQSVARSGVDESLGKITLTLTPNPLRSSLEIGLRLPMAQNVSLTITDLSGRLVATIYNGWIEAGDHELNWDATPLPSGTYICVLRTPDRVEERRLTLIK